MGTGHDTIREDYNNTGDAEDRIKIKEGIEESSVRLRRSGDGDHLYVQLLDGESVTDWLRVYSYYTDDSAKIESVEFADGTVWTVDEFALAEIVGGANDDNLEGEANLDDIFDSDGGGNDYLYGYGGDDVYWLGLGTGHDRIYEYYGNDGDGDTGDKIKIKEGIEESSVRLRRSGDGDHLYVQLLDGEDVTDSLKVENYYTDASAKVESVEFADGTVWTVDEFALAEIVGGTGNDNLEGEANLDDIFDSDGGGNDYLYGYGGNDVYWLGVGTGHDTIYEYYQNAGDAEDKIKIKEGIEESSVRLRRSGDGDHLYVQLLDGEDVTDSLKVENYYTDASAKVESVEFADGTVWTVDEFALAEIVGGTGNDNLEGEANLDDIFDSDGGGNDYLYGYGGNDVYWLGVGTGHDTIYEYYQNAGDAEDRIKIKEGIEESSVRLRRSGDGDHLYVQLLDGEDVTDSLKVENYYTDASAKVESVEFADGTVWTVDEFALAEIVGGTGNDNLEGEANLDDIFDSDGGGNDYLYGYGGNDVYWLGLGTGHDTIYEYYGNDGGGDTGDKIKIKEGIDVSSVRLQRSNNGDHLHVQILDGEAVTDSLTVYSYYTDDSAKIESVEFADGTVWTAGDFALAEIVGGAYTDNLHGEAGLSDVFDSDGGGDDVYWLGVGTGHDTIYEYYLNAGDAGDKIKIKDGIEVSSVDLRRSNNGDHLYVRLLDGETVTDSLMVYNYYTSAAAKVESVEFADGTVWNANEFALAEIVGGAYTDNLFGELDLDDVFDSDGGGNDNLYGYSGNDVYWLGLGTGHDKIHEYYQNAGDAGDKIKIKDGIDVSSVRLRRSNDGDDLYVQLLDGETVTDSLKVESYYTDDSAKVESVEFADGTVWTASDFALAEIVGGTGGDYLYGESDLDDIFDSDGGGNDYLYGYGGDDVYWLGLGTGHDRIYEYQDNTGDTGDKIKVKEGIDLLSVQLRQSGDDLLVEILNALGNATDSLRVVNHYTDESAKIEQIEADGQTLSEDQFQPFIEEIASFAAGDSDYSSTEEIYDHYWQSEADFLLG